MGKSLYRSHRSQSFDEIVGQDHITQTLKNSLKTGSISHAYLLSGPRGTGKTSVARILAYEVNKTPYEAESTHLDIIEIDAASNRRIDEVREIREKVAIAPSQGKYKVYIIDEVHMLTREAFNALLKTLEEPPAHAIFILATTETHKVPETILSRCIRFNFKPIEVEVLTDHLLKIAKKESINISADAVKLLAEHARGSFRDGISLLEQVRNTSDDIGLDQVVIMLGMASKDTLYSIIDAVDEVNLPSISERLSRAYIGGSDAATITSQLQDHYRKKLLEGNLPDQLQFKTAELLEKLLGVAGSSKPRILLELLLVKFALENRSNHPLKHADDMPNQSTSTPPSITKKTTVARDKPKPKKVNSKISIPASSLTPEEIPLSTDGSFSWDAFLVELKNRNNTLYSIVKSAKVSLTQDRIELLFRYSFHLKQINDPKNKALINDLVQSINRKPMEIIAVLSEATTSTELHTPDAHITDSSLQNVSNIFGGHEVLES